MPAGIPACLRSSCRPSWISSSTSSSPGFSLAEVDFLIEEANESSPAPASETEDECPSPPELASAVTRAGDIWLLGRHRLICGDARDPQTFRALLDGRHADLVFTDPPYNVPIDATSP